MASDYSMTFEQWVQENANRRMFEADAVRASEDEFTGDEMDDLDVRGGVASFRDHLDANNIEYPDLNSAFTQASFDFGRANLEAYLNSAPAHETGLSDYMMNPNNPYETLTQRTWGTDNQYLIVNDTNENGESRWFVYEKKGDQTGFENDDYDANGTAVPTNIVEAYGNEYVRAGGPAGTPQSAELADGVTTPEEVASFKPPTIG